MRAMVLRKTGSIESDLLTLEERPEPLPGPGEISIDVEACGVCRTDLHIAEGEVAARLPIVPGHQVAGTVRRVGTGAGRFAPGDPVGIGWLFRACGACEFCRANRENLCVSPSNTGRDADGGYAEVMVANGRYVFPLPAPLSPLEAAPLLCAGIIGYRSLKISGIRPKGRLGLIGFGASAHLAIQVARHWGCRVFAFTREVHHRKLALELGAEWAGAATDDPGVPLDAAVIFAPAGELIPAALSRLARGATLAVNAIHMTPIPTFSFDRLYWERAVRSVANYTRDDAKEFLKLSAEIPVRARVEPYDLEKANAALRGIGEGAIHGAAVLKIG